MLKLDRLVADDPLITDLTGIEHASNMRSLVLSDTQITDITPLAKLTKLTLLFVTRSQISDITPLAGLIGLRRLVFIYNSRISDVTPLAGLTNLTNLHLDGNLISDISPLTGLTNLRYLYLFRNQIRDISALVKLTNLETLGLGNNQISDVAPLAGLTNLLELYLPSNQIRDISPLTGLVNLKELHLVGNPITNKKPLLELLEKNPDVKIYLKDIRTPLPVTLSHFRAEHTDAGVLLKWTTESEVDNAGFYIYRSPTKDGEFKVVNLTMVQGAGTTGERNEYIWTDTSAKPNTVYYYQIEDISHAGVRKQLATVRLKGLISAKGKLTTSWADLKVFQ